MNLSDMIVSNPEGGTFDLTGRELPDWGYFVGGACPPVVVRGEFTPAYAAHVDRFAQEAPAAFVGWWTDEETGWLYVDATDWYASEHVAATQARKRGEIAFWDISRAREVRIAYAEGEQ